MRVSYDAYYSRLGVFPEAVGLTETTILGRAVLYLALTASVAAILGGLWFGAVRVGLPRFSGLPPAGLAAVILVPAVAAVALVAAADKVRDLLVERHFAYYCFQRCKFQPLDESTLDTLNGIAARNASEHPGWHVTELGPAWLVGAATRLSLRGCRARAGHQPHRVGPRAPGGDLRVWCACRRFAQCRAPGTARPGPAA